jgi:plasmid replication initiation protein
MVLYKIKKKKGENHMETKVLQKKEERQVEILKKPSGTIALIGNLSTMERKFFNKFLKNAMEQLKKDTNKIIFDIHLEDLKSILDINEIDKNNKKYKDAIKKLYNTTVTYNALSKDKIINGMAHLIDNLKFETDLKTRETVISYTIPLFVRDSLLNIINGIPESMYAKIDLIVIKGLKSKYAIVIYELCKDYQEIGETPKIEIENFKKILGISEKKAYKSFVNLRIRTLDPAIKELNSNKNIDFTVSYELSKRANVYTHIKFFIKPKNKQILQPAEPKEPKIEIPIGPDPEINQMMELIPETERTLSMKQYLTGILQDYDYNYLVEQIQYTVEQNPKNFMAYLKTAIENDYAQVKVKQKQIESILQEKLQKLEKEKEKMIEVMMDEQKRKIFENYMAKLDSDDVLELRKKCIERVKKENKDIDQFLLNIKVKMMIQDIVLAQPECQEQITNAERKVIEIAEKEYQRKKKMLLNGANDI